MIAYERYVNALKGRPMDFLPRIPILMRFAAAHIQAPYGNFCRDYRIKVKANLQCAEEFGVDLVSVMSDPYCETEGFGARINYQDQGTPVCRHPLLENSKDLDLLEEPDPKKSRRMKNTVDCVSAYKKKVKRVLPILGWVEGPAAEAANLRGVSGFLIDLLEDPGFAAALMERCVKVGLDYAQAQVKAGADTIGIGDAIASQVSPTLYHKLILPKEKQLIDGIREMGAFVRLHICGKITHLLPAMAELPIHILDVDSMVEMSLARAHMGEKTALSGNMAPVEMLMRGQPEKIKAHVQRTYLQVGDPYLVNAGCEVPPETPHENLRALCAPIPHASF